jgi:hypothetical protein
VCWLSQEEDENRRVLLPGVDVDVVVVGASDAEDADPSPCQLIPQESSLYCTLEFQVNL